MEEIHIKMNSAKTIEMELNEVGKEEAEVTQDDKT